MAGAVLAVAGLLSFAAPAAAAPQATLAVAIVGTGSVSSQPAGIDCPGKCSGTFPVGATVVLIAQARDGSTFLRWGGACTGTGKCAVTVSSLVVVAAQFLPGANPAPPAPTKSVAAAGSYSAPERGGQYYGFSFFVSVGGTNLVNLAVTDLVACTPAGSFPGTDQLVIPDIAIRPNGSFAATETQLGVFDNAKAKFSFSFAGRFYPATTAGPPTAAGTLRDNVVFPADGTTETCTTNVMPWTATHDPQAAPTNATAVPGSYSAPESGGHYYGFSFNVLPGGHRLANISVDDLVACTPAGSFPGSSQIVIPGVAIAPDGSFAISTSEQGVFGSAAARFSFSFAGHFEGATPSGPLTVAGTLREDIVFSAGGTTELCSSNEQPWTATHAS
jgi:hypothetical protein